MGNAAFEQRTDAPPQQPVKLNLPFPPSVNGLNENAAKSRIDTKQYEAWKKEAGVILDLQRPYRLKGWYRPTFLLEWKGDKRRRDLSNFWKCVSDLLQAHGVTEDDRYERHVLMDWSTEITGCVVILEYAEAPVIYSPPLGGYISNIPLRKTFEYND